MATLAGLLRSKVLEEFALPEEEEERTPIRPLFLASEVFDQVDADDRFVSGSILKGGRTPFEHLTALFCDLRCAKRPRVGDMRRMHPNHQGVWKCHAPTLRVFGFCAVVNCFVPVAIALEGDLKSGAVSYEAMQQRVLDFIHQHKLADLVVKGEILEVFPA